MKKLCFINGSPRGIKSASFTLIEEIAAMMEDEDYSKFIINVNTSIRQDLKNDFDNMLSSDILIITFPLYYYALPGLLTAFLEEYYEYAKTVDTGRNTKVYAIINCGFPEAIHNKHAAQMIENFCCRLNLEWRFALEIGAGPLIKETKNMSMQGFLKIDIYNGLKAIYADIKKVEKNNSANIQIKARCPNWLYLFQGHRGWLKMAKENGLTKKDLERTPYT